MRTAYWRDADGRQRGTISVWRALMSPPAKQLLDGLATCAGKVSAKGYYTTSALARGTAGGVQPLAPGIESCSDSSCQHHWPVHWSSGSSFSLSARRQPKYLATELEKLTF